MKHLVLVSCLIFTLLTATHVLFAQDDSGQFWVRLYEDRNGSGERDSGEPLITSGAVINLLNANNVVVISALLDDSPNAEQGLIGFQYLEAGDYTLEVQSAVYDATGESSFRRAIQVGGIPTIVEFGGQPINVAALVSGEAAPRGLFGLPIYLGTPEQVGRVGSALLAAVMVAGGMSVLGMFIYLVGPRRRYRMALRAR